MGTATSSKILAQDPHTEFQALGTSHFFTFFKGGQLESWFMGFFPKNTIDPLCKSAREVLQCVELY